MLWIPDDPGAMGFISIGPGTLETPWGDVPITLQPGVPAPSEYTPPTFVEDVTRKKPFPWEWVALIVGATAVIILTR